MVQSHTKTQRWKPSTPFYQTAALRGISREKVGAERRAFPAPKKKRQKKKKKKNLSPERRAFGVKTL
jgi:hypothetical protein